MVDRSCFAAFMCGYRSHDGSWLYWHTCSLAWEIRGDVPYGFQVST